MFNKDDIIVVGAGHAGCEAAAAAANLLYEFNIADKKDAKLIKSKNGKVSLVKVTATSNLSKSLLNPGAIILTKLGMKISISIVVSKRLKTKRLNTIFANSFALFLFFTISRE